MPFTLKRASDPEGKPTVRIGNVSSTSIEIIWTPPPRTTMHGEFMGFKMRYWPQGESASVKELRFGPDTRVRHVNIACVVTCCVCFVSDASDKSDGALDVDDVVGWAS